MSQNKNTEILMHKHVDIREVKETGSSTIDITVSAPISGKNWALHSVEIHLSAAPTTSEELLIQKDDNDGAAYDVVYLSEDLSVNATKDIVYLPTKDISLKKDDTIKISYNNTDTRTYGIKAFVKPRF